MIRSGAPDLWLCCVVTSLPKIRNLVSPIFHPVAQWTATTCPGCVRVSFHLEELVQVLLQVLDEVGVGQFGQDELFDLLRERHLGLSQPRPVERVYTKQTKRSVMCCCTEELGFVL